MLIKYGLFDSAPSDERVYAADEVAVMFRSVARSGVRDLGDCLKITASGSGMTVNMAAGSALVQGYIMDAINDGGGPYALTLTAGGANARIDRVVIRLNLSTDMRTILPVVLQGTPAVTPTAPALTRSGEIYEISLAQIYIAAGMTLLSDASITDERANESLCGAILPEALKLSTLGKTHAHALATAAGDGFMSAAHVSQQAANTSNIAAHGTRLTAVESKATGIDTRLATTEGKVSTQATQLSGLTTSSKPTFAGANLTSTLNMNGSYIDNALFR